MDLSNPTVRAIIAALLGLFVGLAVTWGSSKGKSAPRPMLESLGSFASYTGLLLGCLFWSIYWWDQYHPEAVGGIPSIGLWALVALLGISQPLALPYLVTKLFPRESFQLYIHEKTTNTWAYRIQLATLAGMSLFSFIRIWQWSETALGQVDMFQRFFSAFMIVALSVVVPSLLILDVIPKDWKLKLEVENQVERLRRKAIVEQALIEAQVAQAIVLISLDPLQMSLNQRKINAQKTADILGMLFVRINESTRAIARLMAMLTRNQEMRIQTIDDEEVYKKMYELYQIADDRVLLQIEDKSVKAIDTGDRTTQMKNIAKDASRQVIDTAFDEAIRMAKEKGPEAIRNLVRHIGD